jgi:hypothetical protein
MDKDEVILEPFDDNGVKAVRLLIVLARYLDRAIIPEYISEETWRNTAGRIMSFSVNSPAGVNWSNVDMVCPPDDTNRWGKLITTVRIVLNARYDLALKDVYAISPQNHPSASRIAPRKFFL